MFKIASLYGIGLYPNVNRTPGLNGVSVCLRKYMREFSKTFPNVMKLVKFEDTHHKQYVKTMFGKRIYENPEVIHDVPDKYLIINHGYLHAYRYFSYVMDEIRQLFDFHPDIKAQVEEYAMSAVQNFLAEKYSGKKISLIFFTDDEKFVSSLNFSKADYFNIYRPKLPSRGSVMYFGTKYCDSLLLSATGSTFAYWIGILMPEGKDIFYNRRAFKNIANDMGTHYIDYEKFPKHWNILELLELNNTVIIDNRWNFERYKISNL